MLTVRKKNAFQGTGIEKVKGKRGVISKHAKFQEGGVVGQGGLLSRTRGHRG